MPASAREYDHNQWFTVKDNPLSAVGVFPYSGRQLGAGFEPNEIYQVYRPEEELSDPEALKSFSLVPLIDDHEMLGRDGASPDEKPVHGVVGASPYFSNGMMRSDIKIFSHTLEDAIERGKRELSAGYKCTYEKKSGIWNGQKYDAIQRNIRGNHIALVDQGRMGPGVAVLDHLTLTFDTKEIFMDEQIKKLMTALDGLTEKVAALDAKMAKDEETEEEKKKKEKEAEDKMAADKAAKDEEEAAEKKKKDDKEAEDKKAMDALKAACDSANAKIEELKTAGFKSFVREARSKDDLANRLSQHIGTFDSAEMTQSEVAAYGAEKLGLKVAKGSEQAAVEGYLAAKASASPIFVMDSAKGGLADKLSAYTSNTAN